MILTLYQYIRGYVRIRITGCRTERFLNACSYKKIQVWDLIAYENSCEMNLWAGDFKKLRAISHKTSTHIQILGKYGLPFYFFRHRRRKLFFAGIAAALMMYTFMSGFVWDICISGTHTRTEEELRTFLGEHHITTGMRCRKADCEQIENIIRENYEDIIWVSASMEGTKLKIQIKENEDVKGTESDTSKDATDIIADSSGTIVRMITRSGIPKVREGEEVKMGDLLVSGQIPIYNDAQEITGYQSCASDADIFVQSKLPYHQSMPRIYEKKEKVKRPALIYLYIRSDSWRLSPLFVWKPYKHYTTTVKECPVELLDHFLMPVSVGMIRQTPYRPVRKNYSDQKLENLLNQSFLRYCEDLRKKGVEIIQNDVKIDTGSKEGTMSGTLTVIKKSGHPVQSRRPELPQNQEEQIEQSGE